MAAETLFVLLTNMTLLFKAERFSKNRYRIKACIKELDTERFRPKNVDEDE